MQDKLELICNKDFIYYEDMYKVVDFLNKNLGSLNLVFGLTEKDNKHTISIYKESL